MREVKILLLVMMVSLGKERADSSEPGKERDGESTGVKSHFRRSFHVTSIVRLLLYLPMKPLVMCHCHDLIELNMSGECLSTGTN